VADYVHQHYENVQVFVQENWLRLDFNKDGHVSVEDLRKNITNLYEFMLSYDYFQKATEVKSRLYEEAIKYMKKDLQQDKDQEESHIDDDDDADEDKLFD
jgi:hypothetical protein